jgi:hypothetical protein
MYNGKYPIFISSKGRYTKKEARTIKLLARYEIDYYLIVEEQETDNYLAISEELNPRWSIGNLLNCPDTGLAQSRQYALDYARNLGFEALWCIDDDISNVRQHKVVVNPVNMLVQFEQRLEDKRAGIIAPQYTNVLWRVKGKEIINGQTPGLWFLSRADVPWNYDTELRIGEEADWAFKFALNGFDAIISNEYSIDTEMIGRSPKKVGGIDYNEADLSSSAKILIARYGEFVTPRGDQLRKNWSKIRKALAKAK